MSHDIFISYAAEDKSIADAVCGAIETEGLRCWYAPRDVEYGKDFEESIVDAIGESRLIILILTSHSNTSAHVKREVQNACLEEVGVPVLPFRTEDIPLNKALRYYIGSVHWLDAVTPPLETHLQRLVEHVRARLPRSAELTPSKEPKVEEVGAPAAQTASHVSLEPEPPIEIFQTASHAGEEPGGTENLEVEKSREKAAGHPVARVNHVSVPTPKKTNLPTWLAANRKVMLLVIGLLLVVGIVMTVKVVSDYFTWQSRLRSIYSTTPSVVTPTGLSSGPETSAQGLTGTIWDWKDSSGFAYTYEYLSDGKLKATNKATKTTAMGTWKQSGTSVTVTFGSIIETGTINGSEMSGTSGSKTWTASKSEASETSHSIFNKLLEDTTWKGKDSDEGTPRTYKFLSNGKVQMTTEGLFGTTTEGSWSYDGTIVNLKFGGQTRQAEVKEGSLMEGTGAYEDRKWKWSARKVTSP